MPGDRPEQLSESRRGADEEGPRRDFAIDGGEDYFVAGSRDPGPERLKTDTRRQAELLRLLLATLASDKLTVSPCTRQESAVPPSYLFNR